MSIPHSIISLVYLESRISLDYLNILLDIPSFVCLLEQVSQLADQVLWYYNINTKYKSTDFYLKHKFIGTKLQLPHPQD